VNQSNPLPIRIAHFSDVLCIWAYISQARIDELQGELGNEVALDYHFIHVFGATARKFREQWAERGGLAGYATHVREIAARFDHVELHPALWSGPQTPTSSMPAHLLLCAVRELIASEPDGLPVDVLERLAWNVRLAFFRDGVDVSNRQALLRIAAANRLPVDRIEAMLVDGTAHAALSADLELAERQSVRVSPTMLFNEGRQRLTGNVGYRVIEANVRELLRGSSGQHSWC